MVTPGRRAVGPPGPASRPPEVGRLPIGPGVYRFRDPQHRTLYIGRAVSLRRRVQSYWGGLRDRPRLRRMVAQVAQVEAIECDSEHEAWWLERNLLEASKPRWNRARGGAEVPWFIRLDHREDGTGLRGVHQVEPHPWAEYFGPYLGGQRVKLAVAALDRLFPLRYAVASLSGATRDLAAVRGVTVDDRDALTAGLRTVLHRQPTPVFSALSRLGELRNASVERLAYESAARIHEEHTALQWITADQKVTVRDGPDQVAVGWSGGVMVRLRIRAGRVDAWETARCPEVEAESGRERTPPVLSRFVERAAALAVDLQPAE